MAETQTKRMAVWLKLAVTVLTVLLLSVAGYAQGVRGAVAGVVRDATGAVIPNATVTLKSKATGSVAKTTSNEQGVYKFPLVDNGTYTVTVSCQGFKTHVYDDVEVSPSQTYSLTAILEVGSVAQTVEVSAGQDLVNTETSQVSSTVEQSQILNLPLSDRNPIELLRNQAGVAGVSDATRTTTQINGAHAGWTQVSQDGINIQDNYIRQNGLDFLPNRPTSDTVEEFTVITNTPGADSVGGTSQVRMVTPKGSNKLHGSLYEFNRNSALAANSTSNKNNGLERDQLNLNRFGGTVSGPVWKNKLFFFMDYEGYRERTTAGSSLVVPLYSDYLNGVYRYKSGGVVNTINVLDAVNAAYGANTHGPAGTLGIDSTIKSLYLNKIHAANSTDCGDQLNTGCYAFTQTTPTNRDQFHSRFDYELNERHHFEFVYQHYKDNISRPDADGINVKPSVVNHDDVQLLVGAWRWMVTPTFVNEFRVGQNRNKGTFDIGIAQPSFFSTTSSGILSGLGLDSPYPQFLPQGRTTTTRAMIDNGTWSRGKHNVTFGFTYNRVTPQTFNYGSTEPTLTWAFASTSAMNPYNLTAKSNGDLSSTVRSAVSSLAAFLSGTYSSATQSFYATGKNSGFTAGNPLVRSYIQETYAPYIQDQWHVLSNLSLNFGLKYEYWAPVRENHGLYWLPDDANYQDTRLALMNQNGTVSYHNKAYQPDYMQFAPNFGFAWDPFKNGKTSVRGGYSLSYVNDDAITALNNVLNGNNNGASSSPVLNGLGGNITTNGLPTIPTPTQASSVTFLQQLQTSATSAAWAIDKNIRTPYVHQFDFEIQREVGWNTGVTARYVGTMARDLWQGVDLNQVKIMSNTDYLTAFSNARWNLLHNGDATVGKDVSYIYNNLALHGYLNSANGQSYLYYNEPADLANFYLNYRGTFTTAPGIFLPNPNIYVADEMVNSGVVNFHALQIEVLHRNRGGLQFQSNFTFSKNLTDSRIDGVDSTSQSHFQPYTDNNNKHYDYSRSSADIRKVWNSNIIYELPFGHGKRFLGGASGLLDRLVSGWTASSIIRVQSGTPFSIVAATGSLNRSGRSAYNGAYTKLSHSQIQKLIGIRKVGSEYYWIDPKVLAPDGTAVDGEDADPDDNYSKTFSNQVFFNPVAGQLGNLKRDEFSGPVAFSLDASFAKRTKINDRFNLEFRADFFNLFNRLNWAIAGDFNINSQSFGRISTSNTLSPRVVQASLKLNF